MALRYSLEKLLSLKDSPLVPTELKIPQCCSNQKREKVQKHFSKKAPVVKVTPKVNVGNPFAGLLEED